MTQCINICLKSIIFGMRSTLLKFKINILDTDNIELNLGDYQQGDMNNDYFKI